MSQFQYTTSQPGTPLPRRDFLPELVALGAAWTLLGFGLTDPHTERGRTVEMLLRGLPDRIPLPPPSYAPQERKFATVEKHPVTEAARLLVIIRQLHHAPGIDPKAHPELARKMERIEELMAPYINITQREVAWSVRFLAAHFKLRSVYCEGLTVEEQPEIQKLVAALSAKQALVDQGRKERCKIAAEIKAAAPEEREALEQKLFTLNGSLSPRETEYRRLLSNMRKSYGDTAALAVDLRLTLEAAEKKELNGAALEAYARTGKLDETHQQRREQYFLSRLNRQMAAGARPPVDLVIWGGGDFKPQGALPDSIARWNSANPARKIAVAIVDPPEHRRFDQMIKQRLETQRLKP